MGKRPRHPLLKQRKDVTDELIGAVGIASHLAAAALAAAALAAAALAAAALAAARVHESNVASHQRCRVGEGVAIEHCALWAGAVP